MNLPEFWRPTHTGVNAALTVVGTGALVVLLLGTAVGLDLNYVFGDIHPEWRIHASPSWTVPFLVGWSVLAGLALTVSRIWPRPVSVILPALLLMNLAAVSSGYSAILVTCWTMMHLGRYATPRWRRPAWVAAVVGVGVSVFFRSQAIVLQETVVQAVFYAVTLMVLGFFWLLGTGRRRRDMEIEALEARAELAAISERTRIAREMHDIVAHSLTAVIAQADGGRYIAAKHPEKAVDALETIAATSRSSLAQMRELLSVLREGPTVPVGPGGSGGSGGSTTVPSAERADAPAAGGHVADAVGTAPAPGVDALPQLIRDCERAGLRVSFEETGERRELGPTQQLTVYRIVQEALTNALRHAGGVPVSVVLAWSRKEIGVRVHNAPGPHPAPGRGTTEHPPVPGTGRGLVGMRERVALHGGTLEIGDTADGFTVTARIPVR